ncbi:alpha/beta hydrolase family protein [Zavarzinella formosa]|uniref:alpha/beta hydrolase family protein n=1 Tax=Zavarzinella formosa TaxID=360055 RepID=UPI000304A773|nr:prolyl oligopeptidase family serine peptidase [Zavarzinella formosa]
MLTSLLLIAMSMTPAAEATKADEAIHQYLSAEAKRLSAHFMDDAKTAAEWEAKRPKLREQFLEMLGLSPLPEKTPLKATITGTLERSGVIVENIHFQSKPGLYVTGNLYRPKNTPADKKRPAILYVCGHSNRGRDGNKTAFQDHGMWFGTNGYVCLVVDTLQLGEVAGKHHGTYNLNRFWWQNRGYTPAGVECWNGIRAIDYLCSRPEVDVNRIGVTGISGGGATTVWVAAADERVKVAVPVSGMSDLESYVSNKVINGHCDCMFYINTFQWEWTTALALHAPKPLLFANSDTDPIFPMDGNRRIIARMRTCYEMLGKKDIVEEHVSKGGHDYRPDLRLAIFGFLNKHLKNDTTPIKDADFPKIEGKDLRVFPEDKDLPKDQINDRADELFVPAADVKRPTKIEDFATWKAGLVKQLREKSFRALPEKAPEVRVMRSMSGAFDLFATDGDIEFQGKLLQASSAGDRSRTIVVLNPNDDVAKTAKYWLHEYEKNAFVFAICPRGGLDRAWTRKNPPNTVERSLALLGSTADTGRVQDIRGFLNGLPKKRPDEKIRIFASGQAGILATCACLLSPGLVDEITILDPPASHRDGPYFLNVDRVIDLPTALGLLAPNVKLTLVNAKDKAFDKTATIYKLAAVEGKFERK